MISYYFKSDEITTMTKEINLTTADNQNRGKGKKKKSDPKMGACAPIKITISFSNYTNTACDHVFLVYFFTFLYLM